MTLCVMSSTVSGQWEKTNSSISGQITSMVTNGGNIFAGTSHGLIYSSDGGKHWQNIIINANEEPNRYIRAMVSSKNKMFLLSNGLYSSSDGGFKWVKSQSFNDQALTLAASGLNVIVGNYYGVSISTDEGESWVHKSPPVYGGSGLRIQALTINGNRIYVGYNFGGLFYSGDGGFSWKSTADSITSASSISSLFFDGDNVYAGTSSWSFSLANLYKSTDHGTSWTKIKNGLKNSKVISNARLGEKLFIGTNGNGIFFSNDNGLTWQESNQGLGSISISSIITIGENVYAGSSDGGGVFLLKSGGNRWDSLFDQLTDIGVTSFAKIGSKLFAGTSGGGVFLYSDSDGTWQTRNNGLMSKIITSLLVNDNQLYATTSRGIYKSIDSGASWNRLNSDLTDIYFLSLGIDGNKMYAGSVLNKIYISTNNGINWTDSVSVIGRINSIAIKNNSVLAATDGGIIGSFDKGITWRYIFTKVSHFIKVSGEKIYIGFSDGLFYSDDDGIQWHQINILPDNYPNQHTYLALETYNAYIFLSAGSEGILYSGDNGVSWKSINDNLASRYPNAYSNVRCLSVFNNYLFNGTQEQGIWRRDINTITNFKIPKSFLLEQNFPNPFNPSTLINYEVPIKSLVRLEVYDVLGRKITTLVNEEKSAGIYSIQFNGYKLSSGVYYYTLLANDFIQTKKMILIK